MKAFLYTTIFTLLSLTAALSCSADKTVRSDTTSEYTVSEHLDSLITYFNHLSYIGEHDSIITHARPELLQALKDQDTLTAVYAGLFMAQSYLFLEDMDSVKYCTDRLSPLLDYPLPPNAHIMLSNILGSYSLRTSLDYSKALNHYIEGLSWTEHEERINNRIALLSNIVNIFYVQKSPEGMKFAEEAYRLAMNDPGASGYIKSGANITMAQMLFVQHNYEEALTYLENAGLYAEQSKSMSFYAFINSMFAQIWQNRKDLANADTYYRKAVEYIGYADPGTASQIYLLYGDFLSDTGDNTGAADMYRKGLDISETSGNIEYRQDLLGRIAALTYEAGKYSESAGYSVRYIYYSDSINSIIGSICHLYKTIKSQHLVHYLYTTMQSYHYFTTHRLCRTQIQPYRKHISQPLPLVVGKRLTQSVDYGSLKFRRRDDRYLIAKRKQLLNEIISDIKSIMKQ